VRLVGAATVETRRLMLLARFIITGRDLPNSDSGETTTASVLGMVYNYRQTSAGVARRA